MSTRPLATRGSIATLTKRPDSRCALIPPPPQALIRAPPPQTHNILSVPIFGINVLDKSKPMAPFAVVQGLNKKRGCPFNTEDECLMQNMCSTMERFVREAFGALQTRHAEEHEAMPRPATCTKRSIVHR